VDDPVNASEHVAHDRTVVACLLPSQLLSLEVLRRPLESTPHASASYREILDAYGIQSSMSRSGDCYDNAVAESFFSTLEFELGVETEKLSRGQVIEAVGEYIDGFYNCERRHSTLGSVSPIVFEQRYLARLKKDTDGGSVPVLPLRKRSQERPEVAV